MKDAKRKREKMTLNIVQVVAPPSPLNKSKCKSFNKLQLN